MKPFFYSALFFSVVFITSSAFAHSKSTQSSVVPFANGTWIYDSLGMIHTPGLFRENLEHYNQSAAANNSSHEINAIFAYGSDMEMYCQGSGGSDKNSICNPASMQVYYGDLGNFGELDVAAYLNVTTPGVKQINIPIIDGRMDQIGDGDYLSALNTLTPQQANEYADKVAAAVCADDNVDGIQFDLEPFSFTGTGSTQQGPGQKYFYTEIAKDFSGFNGNSADPEGINTGGNDPLGCVDSAHPNGRIFSIFTFASDITPEVASVLTHHRNGYVVDSLYDLGKDKIKNPQTVPDILKNDHTSDQFQSLASTEISNMKTIADANNLPFQFAIPAAASVHEFKTVDGISNGNTRQISYIQDVVNLITPAVRQDPLFKGTDVWSWNLVMTWHGFVFTPNQPTDSVLSFLTLHL